MHNVAWDIKNTDESEVFKTGVNNNSKVTAGKDFEESRINKRKLKTSAAIPKDLSSYTTMIKAAVSALAEKNGSSRSAIHRYLGRVWRMDGWCCSRLQE